MGIDYPKLRMEEEEEEEEEILINKMNNRLYLDFYSIKQLNYYLPKFIILHCLANSGTGFHSL